MQSNYSSLSKIKIPFSCLYFAVSDRKDPPRRQCTTWKFTDLPNGRSGYRLREQLTLGTPKINCAEIWE